MALRRLILVADDYAISPAVSAGIRALAEARRLSATGVMTTLVMHVAFMGDLSGELRHLTVDARLTQRPLLRALAHVKSGFHQVRGAK